MQYQAIFSWGFVSWQLFFLHLESFLKYSYSAFNDSANSIARKCWHFNYLYLFTAQLQVFVFRFTMTLSLFWTWISTIVSFMRIRLSRSSSPFRSFLDFRFFLNALIYCFWWYFREYFWQIFQATKQTIDMLKTKKASVASSSSKNRFSYISCIKKIEPTIITIMPANPKISLK